jgi:prepilin-type N-terminal cleavage/methylation domain-containing protein
MKSQRGFTLVEIMIAVGIGGMLLTMVFTSLSTMIRSRQAIVDFSTPYVVGPQILDTIEADLRNAYFYDFEDNDAFWGADAEVAGREADGLSFLTASLGRVGEQELRSTRRIGQAEETHRRRSPMSEVQYVCRRSPVNQDWLELWRREDFYVDDLIHDGGIYRCLHDRVFDLKLEYVSRTVGGVGLAPGLQMASLDEVRHDGWTGMEERGLPRAVVVSIAIYARESEVAFEGEPRVFMFRRWIPLPQVHVSARSEGQIATWDGKIVERATPTARPGRKPPGGGAGEAPVTATATGSGFAGGGAGGGGPSPFQVRQPRGGNQHQISLQDLFQRR